jgi:O-antigen/teichoic acid export membrane protein
VNNKGMIAKKKETTPVNLSLRANFSWTFVGNVIYAACQWGMIVLLTKLGSPEMVGQFALGLAVTAPIILFANLQLRSVQATDARQEFQFGHYFGLRLVTTALALFSVSIIVWISEFRWETALVILAIALAKSFEAVSDVFYGLLQQQERMDWIAKSMMIKGPFSLLGLGMGVYFTGSLVWGVAGMVIAWASVLVFYDYRSGAKVSRLVLTQDEPDDYLNKGPGLISPQWEWVILGRLVKIAFPLGIVAMFMSFNVNVPRYFIEHYLGERELGIFAAMAYLMVVGGTVVGALGQSASPRLAKYYAAGHLQAFKELLLKLLGLGIIIGGSAVLVAMLVGGELLTLIYQPEYARQDVFIWLMVAAGISYVGSFLGYGMTAVRYFRMQLPLFAIVACVTALTGFWLIPMNGLVGAAWTLLSGAVAQLVLSSLVVSHALGAKARIGE